MICVGTTSCRTIESPPQRREWYVRQRLDRDFHLSGLSLQGAGRLITNFHLPESTLVMLVSALAGKEKIMTAYKEAVEQKYRFFSFGDAMFIK